MWIVRGVLVLGRVLVIQSATETLRGQNEVMVGDVIFLEQYSDVVHTVISMIVRLREGMSVATRRSSETRRGIWQPNGKGLAMKLSTVRLLLQMPEEESKGKLLILDGVREVL